MSSSSKNETVVSVKGDFFISKKNIEHSRYVGKVEGNI